jgi:hypothetical protein
MNKASGKTTPFPPGEVLGKKSVGMLTWAELIELMEDHIYTLSFRSPQHSDRSLIDSSRSWLEGYLALVEQYREAEPSRFSKHVVRIGLDMGSVVGTWFSQNEGWAQKAGKVVQETFLKAWGDGFAASFKIAFHIVMEGNLSTTSHDLGFDGSAPIGSSAAMNASKASHIGPYPPTIQTAGNCTWASILGLDIDDTEEIDTLAECALRELVGLSETGSSITQSIE